MSRARDEVIGHHDPCHALPLRRQRQVAPLDPDITVQVVLGNPVGLAHFRVGIAAQIQETFAAVGHRRSLDHFEVHGRANGPGIGAVRVDLRRCSSGVATSYNY